MSSSLDMSLDDLILKNKRSDRRGGRSHGSRPGPTRRRFSNRNLSRATPYAAEKPFQAPNASWLHNMFVDRALSVEMDVKLYISNLDYGVSEEDIEELFSEIGGLKQYSIHHDRSGRSKGTAEVVLSRYSDAIKAITRYNDVTLDGKPMKIQIVGANLLIPAAPPVANGMRGDFNGVPRSWQRKQASREQPLVAQSSKGSHGFGRGFGRERPRSEGKSVKDLDADLDKYHAQAMQIN